MKEWPPVTQERVRYLFRYSRKTGLFVRRAKSGPRSQAKLGEVAGHKSKKGYVVIKINENAYKAHRLAWLYVTGKWPEDQIDHKNHVRHDNRWKNLREATNAANQQNRNRPRKDNGIGLMGVSRNRSGFKATIQIHLGTFSSKKAAHAAYLKAKRELHTGLTI